jgi:hypothetical protein
MRFQVSAYEPHLVDLIGRNVGADLARRASPGQRRAGPRRQLGVIVRQRAPVHEPAADEPEGIAPRRLGGVGAQDQPGTCVGGLEDTVEPAEQHLEAA